MKKLFSYAATFCCAVLSGAPNQLDESCRMDGEKLPVYTAPNLLGAIRWQLPDGASVEGKGADVLLKTAFRGDGARLVIPSEPVTVEPGKEYILTALYHTDNAGFGSFLTMEVVPDGKVDAVVRIASGPQKYAPFLNRELYNRRPGAWERRTLTYRVPKNVTRVRILLQQYGAPADVMLRSFYFGLGPWKEDSRKKSYDWKKYVNNLDPVIEREKVEAVLAARPDQTAELLPGDYPRISLGGKIVPPVLYFGDFNQPKRSKYQDFKQAGVDLQMIVLGRSNRLWLGPGKYDFEKMDRLIWDGIGRNPSGNFILLIDVAPYQGWSDDFPQDQAMDATGKPTVSRHKESGRPCYWSDLYRKQVLELLDAWVTHFRKQPYFKAVCGIFIAGNEDGQFYYQVMRNNVLEDGNSPAALPAFRRYLKDRYKNDAGLQAAWNDSRVTLDTAVPPRTEQTYPGNFFDPSAQMPQIDLIRFLNLDMGDFVNAMCKTVKRAAGKPILSVMWFGRGASLMVYPHFSQTSRIFPGKALDLMGAQPGYLGERNAGCSSFISWVSDSVRSNGRMMMAEADFRSWTSPVNTLLSDSRVVRYWNEPDLSGALLREAGRMFAVGGGMWFYDMTGGWFKDPAIMKTVAKIHEIGAKLHARTDVFAPSEIVFVADEENYYNSTEQLNLMNGVNFHTVRKNQRAILRSGIRFDFYYLDDLVKRNLDSYKVYVFLNAFRLSPEKRAFIENKLKRSGKTLVWLYAPNYLTEKGLSAGSIGELTGIAVAEDGDGLKTARYADSPLGGNCAGKIVGIDNSLGGVRFAVTDKTAVPVMRYEKNGKVAGALRDFGSWKSIYLGVPDAFTPEFLGNIARYAGVPVVNTPGDMFLFRRSDLIVLYGVEGRENVMTLPGVSALDDLVSGKRVLPENGKFRVPLQVGEARLFDVIR